MHLVRAHGHFVTPNAVKAGGHIYEAENIVIATGSRPRPLAFPGAELTITSDDVLSERTQPRDVVFIGGGVIAFEFAHVYARAGTARHHPAGRRTLPAAPRRRRGRPGARRDAPPRHRRARRRST